MEKNDINRRMTKCDPKTKKESIQEYKVRLRKVAMSTSKVLIRRALANIRKRIAAVYKEKGRHIDIDGDPLPEPLQLPARIWIEHR